MVVVPDNLDDEEEEDDDDDDDEIHRSLAAVSSALDPSRCNDIHTRSNTYPSSRYNESTAAMEEEEEEEEDEEEKQSVVAGEGTSSNVTPPSDPKLPLPIVPLEPLPLLLSSPSSSVMA